MKSGRLPDSGTSMPESAEPKGDHSRDPDPGGVFPLFSYERDV
jgi:hypothetical protein